MVHTDVVGHLHHPPIPGYKKVVTYIDNASPWAVVYPMRTISELCPIDSYFKEQRNYKYLNACGDHPIR